MFILLRTLSPPLRSHRQLALENLALRHQLDVLKRNAKKPRLTNRDRTPWVILSRFWADWRKSLTFVQLETVIRWHRREFRLHWRWKSRPRWPGRRSIPKEVRDLIRQMSRTNPLWGAPRIHGQLQKLGIEVSEATVLLESDFCDRVSLSRLEMDSLQVILPFLRLEKYSPFMRCFGLKSASPNGRSLRGWSYQGQVSGSAILWDRVRLKWV